MSKLRLRFGGSVGGVALNIKGIQFYSEDDFSAELAVEHDITWAILVPGLEQDYNKIKTHSLEFKILKVGKSGVSDDTTPVLLSETKMGPLTDNKVPTLIKCALNIGLL